MDKEEKEQLKKKLLYEIIKKQIGMIEPYGSNAIDNDRLNNIDNYEYIINSLLYDLSNCIKYKNSRFDSMNKIGKRVNNLFIELKEYIEDCIEEGEK